MAHLPGDDFVAMRARKRGAQKNARARNRSRERAPERSGETLGARRVLGRGRTRKNYWRTPVAHQKNAGIKGQKMR